MRRTTAAAVLGVVTMQVATARGEDGAGHAASFNCAKASTAVERMICGDRQACDLDWRVSAYFRTALQLSAHPEPLRAEQRAWLVTERNRCVDVRCVREAYERRFKVLEALNAPNGRSPPTPPTNDPYPASFVRAPFVQPSAIRVLTESQMGDDAPEPPELLMIDLGKSKAATKYLGDATVEQSPTSLVPYVYDDEPTSDGSRSASFAYSWVGRSTSGVDVLEIYESGGGTGIFESVLMVKVELETPGKKHLLIRRVGQVGLSDRWSGDLRVIGNKLLIGENTGQFADGNPNDRQVIKLP